MPAYQPRRVSESRFLQIRGLRYHLRVWHADQQRPLAGTLLMLHGWMDVSASFQFVVDDMAEKCQVMAPYWRGYGLTGRSGADSYWFPDYLADLDQLLDAICERDAVRIVAHSMGANVAMLYAGTRPERVARIVNLEGMGLPETSPDLAPSRYAQWLGELREPLAARYFASSQEIMERLMRNDPRLSQDKAAFLGPHWALPLPDGRLELAGDP
ncbi:MAG: alpha/beta fold hydrolase [Quisquiliibacterium sp.]